MKRALLLVFLVTSSCTLVDLAKEPPAKRRFLLDVADVAVAGAAARTKAKTPVVAVEQAHALSPFNGRALVYRTTEHANDTDFYNEFLVPPAEQVTQITRRWLRDHRTFPHVITSGSPLIADRLLTIDLAELRADLRDAANPRAVVEMRYALFRVGTERESLFAKRYRAEVKLASDDAEAIVRGFSKGVGEILQQVLADLAPFGK